MPDLIACSEALRPELVPIPGDAPDVCPLCRSGTTQPESLCSSCRMTTTQVAHACGFLIPISYYTTPSRLRDRMHDYKDSAAEQTLAAEQRNVASLLVRYVSEHRAALAARFGPWDALVAVPSTRSNRVAPLQVAVETNFPDLLEAFEQPLALGSGSMAHRRADEAGFKTNYSVRSRRFLLVDDTFTTGARIHSAHHALVTGGASVAVAVIVTRKISPDPKWGTDKLWDRQSAQPFDFTAAPWWT